MKLIRKWHIKERGWRDIGYHIVILNGRRRTVYDINDDGLIELGRDVKEIGAHTKDENDDSIGICMIGKENFSPKQFESLYYIIKTQEKIFPGIKIKGHNEYSTKSCPNISMDLVRKAMSQVSVLGDLRLYFNQYF